jgi:hypothetical protein
VIWDGICCSKGRFPGRRFISRQCAVSDEAWKPGTIEGEDRQHSQADRHLAAMEGHDRVRQSECKGKDGIHSQEGGTNRTKKRESRRIGLGLRWAIGQDGNGASYRGLKCQGL